MRTGVLLLSVEITWGEGLRDQFIRQWTSGMCMSICVSDSLSLSFSLRISTAIIIDMQAAPCAFGLYVYSPLPTSLPIPHSHNRSTLQSSQLASHDEPHSHPSDPDIHPHSDEVAIKILNPIGFKNLPFSQVCIVFPISHTCACVYRPKRICIHAPVCA